MEHQSAVTYGNGFNFKTEKREVKAGQCTELWILLLFMKLGYEWFGNSAIESLIQLIFGFRSRNNLTSEPIYFEDKSIVMNWEYTYLNTLKIELLKIPIHYRN